MNILILEDDPNRIEAFKKNLKENKVIFTEDAFECIDLLKDHSDWDILMLDHDLGRKSFVSSSEENTGATVARFLNGNPRFKPHTIIIHTMNPAGAKYMMDLLPGSLRVIGAWNMELD